MADPVVRVEPTNAVVEPGGQVSVTVTVANTGLVVEGFRLTVHGGAANWAEVVATGDADPEQRDVVWVYPGEEGTATVVFAGPPVSAGFTGVVPFCVLAQSVVDASRGAVAEGDLEIGRVDGLAASITPVTSTGRWSGQHTVKVSNWGNTPVTVRLTASDSAEALGYLVHPEHLELLVGGSAVAAVRVRSRRPFLRGSLVRLPFRVVAEPESGAGSSGNGGISAEPSSSMVSSPRRPVLDGALIQKPVLSRATVSILVLGILGLAAAVAMVVTADRAPATERPVDMAVPVPAGLSAIAEGDTRIRLNWQPLPRDVDGYQLFRIRPGTQEQIIPVTQQDVTVSGDRTEHTFEDLEPVTEFCFQISAVRGESRSPRSPAVCGTTQETLVEAAPTSSAPVSENAPLTGPASSGTSAEPSSGAPDLTSPAGEGGSSSPVTVSEAAPSATGASESVPIPRGTGPTPGPTSVSPSNASELLDFGDGWVLGRPIPAGPTADEAVQRRMDTLTAALQESGMTGFKVGTLDSERYPRLGFIRPVVVVYVGPFRSQEEAAAACPALGFEPSTCLPRQPGTPR